MFLCFVRRIITFDHLRGAVYVESRRNTEERQLQSPRKILINFSTLQERFGSGSVSPRHVDSEQRGEIMKLASIVFAATITAIPGWALAQSSPSPNNQSGPGVSPSVEAPTDQGIGSESGNVQGVPERGSMGVGTTGMQTEPVSPGPRPSMREPQLRGASPASPAEGVEKEK